MENEKGEEANGEREFQRESESQQDRQRARERERERYIYIKNFLPNEKKNKEYCGQ